MKKKIFVFSSILVLLSIQASAQTVFNYTGSVQYYVVPSCVDSVTVDLSGAQGGDAVVGGATGGLGGHITGKIAVTVGETLYVYVGGQNGYNGGGQGGIDGNSSFGGPPIGTYGGWGGGASDIRVGGNALVNRVAVAGGGGGAGNNGVWPGCQVSGPGGNGGIGGGNVGGSGTFGIGTPCSCGGGGGDGATGGSQVAGGLHGNYYGNTACLRANWAPGSDGSLGQGGVGSIIYYNGTGGSGGGGGGYYGGGSGGQGSDTTPGGGGGGGSSFVGPLANATQTAGTNSGNGVVIITPLTSNFLPPAPGPISGAGAYCIGDTISLSVSLVAGAVDYTWSLPAGTNLVSGATTEAIIVVVGNTSGNVTVTANNTCGSSAASSTTLTSNSLPIIIATATEDTICNGSPTFLQASGANTYSWSSGGSLATETVTPGLNTTYTVTGTDLNSCSNTTTVDVVVNLLPVVFASASSDTICNGNQTILTATGANTYSWSSGGVLDNETVTPISNTTYIVTGTDANLCSSTASIDIVVNQLPLVIADSDTNMTCFYTGSITLLGSPAGGNWSGTNISGNLFTPNTVGIFEGVYSYVDGNGCGAADSILLTVVGCEGIESDNNQFNANIYPNPGNGNFNLSITGITMGVFTTEVIDITGKLVYTRVMESYGDHISVPFSLSDLREGIYLFRIVAANGTRVIRFVKN